MKKWVKRSIFIVLLAVFLGSTGYIGYSTWQYKVNERLYTQLAGEYTQVSEAIPADAAKKDRILAPITVDFAALQQQNPDVVGWIYCEDSVINYPILQGEDNDYYLYHSIDGAYSKAGSIFMEADNKQDFQDPNTILYGHHMKDKSMFASIEYWAEQAYYEDHPVMWILTPEQDYKVLIFSGYNTPAVSDTYKIFHEPCPELNEYLSKCAAQSDFETGIEPDGKGKYVVLSTCSYVFEDARYVLHGVMVPVNKRP